MQQRQDRERARTPEDLSRFIVERFNTDDVDGVVELYESDAVLALPNGGVARGADEIRRTYEKLLADRVVFVRGRQQPTLSNGNLALTSSQLGSGVVTVEVARRQPDGTWRWIIDQPNVAG